MSEGCGIALIIAGILLIGMAPGFIALCEEIFRESNRPWLLRLFARYSHRSHQGAIIKGDRMSQLTPEQLAEYTTRRGLFTSQQMREVIAHFEERLAALEQQGWEEKYHDLAASRAVEAIERRLLYKRLAKAEHDRDRYAERIEAERRGKAQLQRLVDDYMEREKEVE